MKGRPVRDGDPRCGRDRGCDRPASMKGRPVRDGDDATASACAATAKPR